MVNDRRDSIKGQCDLVSIMVPQDCYSKEKKEKLSRKEIKSSRGKSLLKTAYVIFVILKSHDSLL